MDDQPEDAPEEGFFDASFLSELEGIAGPHGPLGTRAAMADAGSVDTLAALLARPGDLAGEGLLTENELAVIPSALFTERTNALIDASRRSPHAAAGRAVESFVVFVQALLPTLQDDGAVHVRRLFHRLAPTLVHLVHNGFAGGAATRDAGLAALRNVETILIEISSVRLAPSEGELVFRSIDQMAGFIAAGEYAMANEVISSQLLGLIARNLLARALYRLMEVEVSVQRYVQQQLGYATPQVRLPGDIALLSDYGPLRVFDEEGLDGVTRRFIQVQLPDMARLDLVVLHLVSHATHESHRLRLDATGTALLQLPDGTYSLGLVYEPDVARPG
jgi:hypothetical protein